MVNVELDELLWMLVDPLADDLDVVVGHILALFLEDGNYICGGARRDRHEQHLERAWCGLPFTFRINRLSVSAGRDSDKKMVACVMNRRLVIAACHQIIPRSISEILTHEVSQLATPLRTNNFWNKK